MNSDNAANSGNPFYALNEKAKRVNSGDASAIEEVADHIIGQFGLLEFPIFARTLLKERLVLAETRFRRGEHPGIAIEQIVQALNALVAELGGPDFARTDNYQLEHLRAGCTEDLPELINQTRMGDEGTAGQRLDSKLNPVMSPLEAAFVAMCLIFQKQKNAVYQVSPEQFARNVESKEIERRKHEEALRTSGHADETRKTKWVLRSTESTATFGYLRVGLQFTKRPSKSEAIQLIESTLETAGF